MGNFGGMGAALDAKIEDGAKRLAAQRKETADARVRQVCERAAALAVGDGRGDGPADDGPAIVVRGGRVSIGSVSVAQYPAPEEPSLVPRPSFVAIAGHVALLEEMLLEWEGGGHLLLLGDQGVGKNKLADRLLQLLGAEREYVQLHREESCPPRGRLLVMGCDLDGRGDGFSLQRGRVGLFWLCAECTRRNS